MYKEKKKNNLKTGQIALVETHFSHAQLFPCISSSASQRELPACKTAVQMKLNPSPSPGLLLGTECCGPGVQLVGCCSRKSPLGFQFCADPCKCASVGKKKLDLFIFVSKPPGRLWQMSPKCLIFPDPKDISRSLKGSRVISARRPGNDCLPVRNRAWYLFSGAGWIEVKWICFRNIHPLPIGCASLAV